MTTEEIEILDLLLEDMPEEKEFNLEALVRGVFDRTGKSPGTFRAFEEAVSIQVSNFFYSRGLTRPSSHKHYILCDEGLKLKKEGNWQAYFKTFDQAEDRQRLDWMLDFFANHGNQSYSMDEIWRLVLSTHRELHNELQHSYKEQIFEKLIEDNLIEETNPNTFRVKFNGRLFNKSGGYLGKEKSEIHKDKLLSDNLANQNELHPLITTSNRVGIGSNIVTAAIVTVTLLITAQTCEISKKTLVHEYQRDTMQYVIKTLQKNNLVMKSKIDSLKRLLDSMATAPPIITQQKREKLQPE